MDTSRYGVMRKSIISQLFFVTRDFFFPLLLSTPVFDHFQINGGYNQSETHLHTYIVSVVKLGDIKIASRRYIRPLS